MCAAGWNSKSKVQTPNVPRSRPSTLPIDQLLSRDAIPCRPRRPTWPAAGKERQHAVGEGVGAFDLRHVADAGEQVGLGVRENPARGVEMSRGHDAIAIAPDDQGGARMLRDAGG